MMEIRSLKDEFLAGNEAVVIKTYEEAEALANYLWVYNYVEGRMIDIKEKLMLGLDNFNPCKVYFNGDKELTCSSASYVTSNSFEATFMGSVICPLTAEEQYILHILKKKEAKQID